MADDAPTSDDLKSRIIRAKLGGATTDAPAPEKVFYNELNQPFTMSGKPVPPPAAPPSSYTGSALPLSRDEKGLHPAWPEMIASPIRGAATGGKRALGVGEQGQNPLRPLSPDELAAVSLGASPLRAGALPPAIAREPQLTSEGRSLFTRAIKPPVGSIKAAGGREAYYDKTESGVQSIIRNKDNLRFVDADGNVVSGETPKTLDQFSDALDQTKQKIFQQYDRMAWDAGMVGPPIDLRPVAAELTKIANDQVVIDFHPGLAAYAAEQAQRMITRGSYWAEDAQRAVQNLNTSLKAFYRNPTYETAAKANVDAMMANKLRSLLDDAVSQAAGDGYQGLRNQYGALKAIENDVKNRATVVSRQEKGGGILGRIADVGSAEEVLRGMLTLSPGTVARGALLKGWSQLVKRMRDPNRAVMKLFEGAEQTTAAPGPGIQRFGPLLMGETLRNSQDDTMRRASEGQQ